MLILGKMSFGVFRIASPPLSRIKIASTINVYGLRNARLTIHIAVGYLLDLRFLFCWKIYEIVTSFAIGQGGHPVLPIGITGKSFLSRSQSTASFPFLLRFAIA